MFEAPQYEELSNEECKTQYDELVGQWDDFLLMSGNSHLLVGQDYFIHGRNLFEVIRRCDKRRAYFNMFHRLKDICEYKSVAIKCFWINSLKPFMVVNEESAFYNCPNEMFSLYLILSTIRGEYKKIYPDKEFKYPCEARIQDIIYDFKYCGLNREAMVAFVETLADCYGVGIDYILKNLY